MWPLKALIARPDPQLLAFEKVRREPGYGQRLAMMRDLAIAREDLDRVIQKGIDDHDAKIASLIARNDVY